MTRVLFNQLRKLFGLEGCPVIMPYRGYGRGKTVYVKGHVLDDKVLYESAKGDRKRKNMIGMLSRYMSKALTGREVVVNLLGQEFTLKTDEKGYFEAALEFEQDVRLEGWIPISYQLAEDRVGKDTVPPMDGEVYFPEQAKEYGIISDVDDTIIVSRASKTLRKLNLILFKNAKTRLPFAGVSAFYKALKNGTNGNCCNPIFYVSSSEYNLYDFLVDFCEAQEIPKGVFLLQQYKNNLWEILKSGGGSHTHKADKIRHLLQVYPDTDFVLIGDSGQRDALLYSRIVEEYPERIKVIYIRNVSDSDSSIDRLNALAKKVQVHGVDMLLVEDTAEAARHALAMGLIREEDCRRVEAAV